MLLQGSWRARRPSEAFGAASERGIDYELALSADDFGPAQVDVHDRSCRGRDELWIGFAALDIMDKWS